MPLFPVNSGFSRLDRILAKQVEIMFEGLNRQSASDAFPRIETLASLLSSLADNSATTRTVAVSRQVLTSFATAAVEMWLRAIHSFLISASLTEASPIWASVSGYYASHYAIRGFAHLLGVFQLHKIKKIVYLQITAQPFVCSIEKKSGWNREHKFYWKYVSEHPSFSGDPFFYPNREDLSKSDGSHRNKANYADHVNRFPVFEPLESEYIRQRVERISNIEFSDVPIPSADRFPDIDSVQIVAYHRIVKFRRCVDEVLGEKNRFWRVHRKPSWCPDTMTFSLVDPAYLKLYASRS